MRALFNKGIDAAVKRNLIIKNGEIHTGLPEDIGQADLIAARSGTYFRPPQAIDFLASFPSNEHAAPVQAIAGRVAFCFVFSNLALDCFRVVTFMPQAGFSLRIQTTPLIVRKQIESRVPVRRETQFDEFFRAD